MVAGPTIAGVAVAKADLLGVGPDIDVLGIDLLGSGQKKNAHASGRNASLPTVSTAPSTRSVVVRGKVPAAQAEPKVMPAASFVTPAATPAVTSGAPMVEAVPVAPAPAAPPIPAAVPLSGPLPLSGPAPAPAAPPMRSPAPGGIPITTTIVPGPGGQLAPADSYPRPIEIPDSFRVGYADSLRAATTADLFAAALPGVAGIAGFTLLGAYAGYRQAHAVQAALLPPVPTSILL
jgi:hypothetical protein